MEEDGRGLRNSSSRGRSFKFEASWLQEEMCTTVVENAWRREEVGRGVTVAEVLKGVAGDLKEWSSHNLGDMEKRIARLKKELEACRR